MKLQIKPTNREIHLDPDKLIVSKTDTKGRLIYANRTFMEISGFSEPELMGKQHNIVRHPDMPRAVFHLLWQTIQHGHECFAYVKNLTKNGDHYWVLANVTPDYDEQGNICGYFSVRRRPRDEAVQVIEKVYQEMVTAEHATNAKDAIAAGTDVLNSYVHNGNTHYDAYVLSI